jgi:hypothetical protein
MANIKTETFTATMANAHGRPLTKLEVKEGFAPLPASIEYEVTYDALLDIASVKEVNEYPKDADIVDFVNAKRKANARQKAGTAKLDSLGRIIPTAENDDDLKLKNIFDTLMLMKNKDGSKQYTVAEARATAETVLGLKWSDDGASK